MLASLHSDLLLLIAGNLAQIVDLCRLTRVCRSVREKLEPCKPRIARARARYASLDLEENYYNAVVDRQRHFEKKYRWLSDSEQRGKALVESGDIEAVEKFLAARSFDIPGWKLGGLDFSSVSHLPMLDFILERLDDERICDQMFGISNALARQNVDFARRALQLIKSKPRLLSHMGKCNCLLRSLVRTHCIWEDNVPLMRWLLEEFPDIPKANFYTMSFEMSRLLKKIQPESESWFRLLEAFRKGRLAEIDGLVRLYPLDPENETQASAVLDAALRGGLVAAVRLVSKLFPSYCTVEKLSQGSLRTDSRELVLAYARWKDVLPCLGDWGMGFKVNALVAVLDKFREQFTPEIAGTFLVEHSDLSCLYQLTKRFPQTAAQVAARPQANPILRRVVNHVLRREIHARRSAKRQKSHPERSKPIERCADSEER